MMGRRLRLCLLSVLCSLLLLCAASVWTWAAPAIGGMGVERGRDTGSVGEVGYHEWVILYIEDPDGAADLAQVSVTDSQQQTHDAWCQNTNEDGTWAEFWWQSYGQMAAPPPGAYLAHVKDQAGHPTDEALAQTSEIPDETPVILTPPAANSLVYGNPIFSWSAAEGVGCFCLGVHEVDGPCAIWCPSLNGGPVTSPVEYGCDGTGEELLPGHLYGWHVISHVPDPIGQSDPRAWAVFGGIADGLFTIYSPDPVIEQVHICRGRFLWEPGATEETYHESAQVTVRDWDDVEGLSLVTVAPDGTSRPAPDDGGGTWDDGQYRLYQSWCHDPLGPLPVGAYTIIAQDPEGHTASILTCDASEVPPMFAMMYPLDGEIIPDWDTQPAFSWEPIPGADRVCVCVQTSFGDVLWVKPDLPGTTTSVQYNDDGSATPPELSPGTSYRVHVRALFADEDPSPVVLIESLVGCTIEFTVYSPDPVIQDVNICRGRDTDAPDWAKYHERVRVRVRDSDGAGDIASITMTDSAGVEHITTADSDCWCQEDEFTVSFGWCEGSLLAPPPAGTYEIRAADREGNEAIPLITPEAGEVSEVHPELMSPPMDSVIYESTPTFEWTPGVPGSVYTLDVFEEGTWEKIWSVALDEGTEAPYNFNDSALCEKLEPNRSYFWVVNSGYAEDDRVSDPRVWIYAAQDTHGRFTVYGDWPEVPPALPGKMAYTAVSGEWAYAAGAAYSTDPHLRAWLGPEGSESNDWSPDGSTLLYSKDDRIWMDALDASAAVQIPGIGGGACRWAPDGSRICFTQTWDDVLVADVDGSDVRVLAAECGLLPWPAWSPDGRWVSYRRSSGMWMVRSDGTEDHPVTATGIVGHPGCEVWMGDAAWSPDGQKLAVSFGASGPEEDISGIGVIAPEGGLLTPVLVAPPGVICCAAPQNPRWSPDGAKIAFNSGHHLPDPAEWAFEPRAELWMVNADGSGEPVRLTYDNSYNYAISWWAPNTEPGTQVSVPICDVTTTFSKVTRAGSTSATVVDPTPSPPSRFTWIGEAYRITTTAAVQGAVKVAIHYDLSLVPGGKPGRLALLHFENGKWADVTDEVVPEDRAVIGAIRAPSASGGKIDLSLFAVACKTK